ncbi:hypothetical protein ACFL0V_06070 [Nanoarchaeota archaeon]
MDIRGSSSMSLYVKSLKQIEKKSFLYCAVDFGMFLLIVGCAMLFILFVREDYFSFVQMSPRMASIGQALQVQENAIVGADLNLYSHDLVVLEEGMKTLAIKALGGLILVALMVSVIVAGGNAYLWNKILKKKKTLHKWLNYLWVTLVLSSVWLALFVGTLYTLKGFTLLFVWLAFALIFMFTYQIAYSYAQDNFKKWLKDMFIKPFMKIHHYALVVLLIILSFIVGFNILVLLFFLVVENAALNFVGTLATVLFVLMTVFWTRNYLYNLKVKLYPK